MKIPVPKNWKVIKNTFGRIVWQHGQRNVIATPQPKYRGWKWTSGSQVSVEYDGVWYVRQHQPSHPIITRRNTPFLHIALESAREVMKEISKKYPEEEYG